MVAGEDIVIETCRSEGLGQVDRIDDGQWLPFLWPLGLATHGILVANPVRKSFNHSKDSMEVGLKRPTRMYDVPKDPCLWLQ